MRLVLVREGYLQQLKGLAEASRSKRVEPVELHSVVDLLRAATLDVTEAVAKWRACLVRCRPPAAWGHWAWQRGSHMHACVLCMTCVLGRVSVCVGACTCGYVVALPGQAVPVHLEWSQLPAEDYV